MNIGINLDSKLPYQEIIDAFLQNGINRTFVCIEHPQFAEVMRALKNANIVVDNFHAPFKKQNTIWKDGEEGDAMLSHFLQSVDLCVEYGIDLMVAHVTNGRPMPPITQIGLERFDKFISYAQSNGVKIAFENHRYVENVKFIMDRYPEAGFCLDTSHENGFTPGIRYMPMWGDRLVATHLSDNETVCDKDMHMIPFDGNINFEQTAKEIAASSKEVTLMLEIKQSNHPMYSNMTVKEYYSSAADSIKKFADMVDSFR